MVKAKMVLCFLLAAALILPLALSIAPAVQADSEEPQEQAEATLALGPPPDVTGCYRMKIRATGYDWLGNKFSGPIDALLWIPCKYGNPHAVEVQFFLAPAGAPGVSPYPPQAGQPQMEKQPGYVCPVHAWNGYVGSMLLDANGKCKNKPRLSTSWAFGTYFQWPAADFDTYTLNACVSLKYNKLTHKNDVKSIKGTINGWGEWGTNVGDGSPQFGQYEFKFTATPVPCD